MEEVEEKEVTMQDQLYNGFWVDYYDTAFPAKENAERAKRVVGLIKKFKPDSKKMLELACGTGNYTVYWTRLFKVKATDLSKDMIKRARRKCKGVTFKEVSMTSFREPAVYDVVTCMWESFRYNENYRQVVKTLRNIHHALKKDGLFVVDFHHFAPKKKEWFELDFKSVVVNGKTVHEHQQLRTCGNYDIRKSRMNVDEKTVNVVRSPLLRISEEQMRKFLARTGFEVVHFQRKFVGPPQSMLFIARKVK